MTLPLTDSYLAAVSAELADLDAADRDDLLEDLQLHLVELRAEDPEVDLVARLGTPAAFAEELRQSAGLPAPSGGPSVGARVLGLRDALLHKASRRPWVRTTLDFLPQLRPAWWVLRAYGVLAVVDALFHASGYYRWGIGVVPQVHGEQLFGFVLLAGLVVASVRIATRPPVWRRWGPVALVANAVLAIATPAYFFNVQGDRVVDRVYDGGYTQPCCGTLYGDNGSVISNLFAYDADGHLIPQVQLFDQDGNPVQMSVDRLDGGASFTNVYPRQQFREDGTVAVPTPPAFGGPQVVSPQASPSETRPSPAATPAATASATPLR